MRDKEPLILTKQMLHDVASISGPSSSASQALGIVGVIETRGGIPFIWRVGDTIYVADAKESQC